MHLHGHVHLNADLKFMPGQAMDVGMDGNDLHVYNILHVAKFLTSRPIKSLFNFDHHNKEVK